MSAHYSNNPQQPPPSPMHPVAPPTKKQRSSQPPLRGGRDALSTAADDAIARRRAELRRLQQKRTQQQGAKGLLDQARTQLGPPMPPQQHVARARHSDIFPNVTKSVAPPPSSRKPTPRVARRLDPSFEEKKSRSRSAPPMRPPPPPVPPPLVAEAPPERTPPPITPSSFPKETTTTPSTARRDTLRNLREMAPAPSEDVQLVKELKLAQDEKADALRKVARLKEQIQQLQKAPAPAMSPQQSVSQVTFLSPLNASATPNRGSRSASSPALLGSARKRVPTPHPKRKSTNNDDEMEFLQEAASSIPYEYTSTLATYIVRRPYVSSSPQEPWNTAGTKSAHEYQSSLSVHTPSTLEVCAMITADDSTLTLSGVSTVRHKNAATQEWKVFEDVDAMDKPLGCVLYIDSDASEKEYWLDAIYEEAFAAREAYCSSLISAAAVLQARKEQGPRDGGSNPLPQQTTPTQKPQVEDACVGTEDLNAGSNDQQAATKQVEEVKPSSTSKPPPKELESSSSDVLSVFLGMIFSSLVGLVWLVLVRIPFKIFTFTLLLVTASAFLSIIWLYSADDHGAESFGAGMKYGFNNPGIV